MRRHWRFLFALNFIYTSLTFLWSIFVKPSLRFPFSVWKQKFKGNRIGLPSSRCSCPIACKREELIHSQVKLLSGFAEIGSFFFFFFFFVQTISLSSIPQLVCLLHISYIILLLMCLCIVITSTLLKIYEITNACVYVYIYMFVLLWCG